MTLLKVPRPIETPGLRTFMLAVLAALCGATAYELASALGALKPGPLPGQGPPGDDPALIAGLLSMLAGAVLVAIVWLRSRGGGLPEALLAPAAAAFMTARFYTFDPYYAPTLRRMSEGGMVPEAWVFWMAAGAGIAALLTFLRSPPGLALTSLSIVMCAATALAEAGGH